LPGEVAAASLRITTDVDVGDVALVAAAGRSPATPPRTQRRLGCSSLTRSRARSSARSGSMCCRATATQR